MLAVRQACDSPSLWRHIGPLLMVNISNKEETWQCAWADTWADGTESQESSELQDLHIKPCKNKAKTWARARADKPRGTSRPQRFFVSRTPRYQRRAGTLAGGKWRSGSGGVHGCESTLPRPHAGFAAVPDGPAAAHGGP